MSSSEATPKTRAREIVNYFIKDKERQLSSSEAAPKTRARGRPKVGLTKL